MDAIRGHLLLVRKSGREFDSECGHRQFRSCIRLAGIVVGGALQVVEIQGRTAVQFRGRDDDSGRCRGRHHIEEFVGEEIRGEVIHRECAFDPVSSFRSCRDGQSGIVDECIDPVVRVAKFVGECANRVLASEIGLVEPDLAWHRIRFSCELFTTALIPADHCHRSAVLG
jgi:hypothetical protein